MGRKLRFAYHPVAAVHLWAFLMLLLLVEYALVPSAVGWLIHANLLSGEVPEGQFITTSTEIAMLVYMTISVRRIYGTNLFLAFLQAVGILLAYTLLAATIGRASGMI